VWHVALTSGCGVKDWAAGDSPEAQIKDVCPRGFCGNHPSAGGDSWGTQPEHLPKGSALSCPALVSSLYIYINS
jgi:hypothetical protein